MIKNGWKKFNASYGKNKIRNVISYKKEDGHYIHIIHHIGRDKNWEVRVNLVSQGDSFKTKKQAWRYAKAYMRKH